MVKVMVDLRGPLQELALGRLTLAACPPTSTVLLMLLLLCCFAGLLLQLCC